MTDAANIIGYIVTHRQRGKAYAFNSSVRASRFMDRCDLDYGAICTSRRAIWSDDAAGVAEFNAIKGN